MQTRLLVLLCIVLVVVDCLPRKHSKKKLKNEEKEDSVTDFDVSSTSDGTSDEDELNALEKIGFKQENVRPPVNTAAANIQQQLPAISNQLQPQNNVASNTNTSFNPLIVGQQQSYNATQTVNTNTPVDAYNQQQTNNTIQTGNTPVGAYNQLQYSNTNITQPITNTAAVAFNPPQVYNNTSDPTGSLFNNQQPSANNVNKNTTSTLAYNFQQVATPAPLDARTLEEMKCFQRFDNMTREGQNATQLVEIYEELHDCLKGKCNYKKAEKGLSGCLGKETTNRAEQTFYNYKCYFNWYELIKKVCTPDNKLVEIEDDNDEKEVE